MNQMRFHFRIYQYALLLLILCSVFPSCKDLKVQPKVKEDRATYFSVRQFLDDQWETRHGQPVTLMRKTTFNHISDSAYIGLDSTLWLNIRKVFDAVDIGDPKYLGQYKFSIFSDSQMDVTYLNYEALHSDLFMQTMNIGMDQFTHKVRSLYIETSQKSRIYSRIQKLLYVPDKLIQIQETEQSVLASGKDLKIEYIYR